jgi:hypothetical protein
MEKIPQVAPEQEILTPPVIRANQPKKTNPDEWDKEVLLGSLSDRHRPVERYDRHHYRQTCPECGSVVPAGAERCACGLDLEDM